MIKEINGNGRICSFYASDYHFEMISLPYIKKQLEENKDVVILTENDLEDTVQVLLSRMNLTEDEKEKIINLNWKEDYLAKFKKIKEVEKQNKEVVIFIKGKENYISNVNKNIEAWIERTNTQLIDCYDMNEIGNDVTSITNQYDKVLNTTGKIDIQKNQ